MKKRIEPFLRWAGGKRWLAQRVGPILQKRAKRGVYIEPFLGAGAMFFSVAPARAILGDINADLINSFRMVASRPRQLLELIRQLPVDEETYYQVRDSKPRGVLRNAARFIYLNRTCYGGLYRENKQGKFNVPFGGGERTTAVLWKKDLIQSAAEVLKERDVRIENCDFEECLNGAQKGDIVYCDPVYHTGNRSGFDRYGASIFGWSDQERLAGAVARAFSKGATVLVSNACHPDLLDIFPSTYKFRLYKPKSIGNRANNQSTHNECLFVFDPYRKREEWMSLLDMGKNL